MRDSASPRQSKADTGDSRSKAPAHAESRSLALDDVFSLRRITAVWATVRAGLRRQPISDLHDYLDVHRNLGAHAQRIRDTVLSGRYRPTPPEITTSEKAEGVCRRLLLPSPTDAIVLQVLTQALLPVIEQRQPTKNAYYSTSQTVPKVEHIDGTFGYEWWILWPQFQKRIWDFTRSCPFVVVTDVANYFDCIPHASLRNAIAAMGQLEESVLDLLFYALEAFTWRPFYLPSSGVGIPQMDLEAPRLLAHAYLFTADTLLAKATDNHVVRWMDDINFGVGSIAEARRILGQLEALLNGYGLRLNGGKTKVLSGEDAVRHFWMRENRRLTMVEQRLEAGMLDSEGLDRARRFLRRSWREFKRQRPVGQYEKVKKRYFTLFGKLGDDILDRELLRTFCHAPRLRDPAFRYLRTMGFSRRRLSVLEHFLLKSGTCLDDESLFSAARTLTTWRIPVGRYTKRICTLAEMLPRETPASVTAFLAGLWLLVKYAPSAQLARYLAEHQSCWTRSEWAARQVAAALPRLTNAQQRQWGDLLVHAGLYEGVGVLAHYRQLRHVSQLDRQLRSYLLHPPKAPFNYELPKFLLALAILDGALPLSDRKALQDEILAIVDDPAIRAVILGRIPGAVTPPATTAVLPRKRVATAVASA